MVGYGKIAIYWFSGSISLHYSHMFLTLKVNTSRALHRTGGGGIGGDGYSTGSSKVLHAAMVGSFPRPSLGGHREQGT